MNNSVKIYSLESGAELLFSKRTSLYANFLAHSNQEANCLEYLNRSLTERFLKPLPQGFKYLDVGCGLGTITKAVVSLIADGGSMRAVAIDPSTEMVSSFAADARRLGIELRGETLESVAPAEKFDLITALHVFYYVRDCGAAIEKLTGMLTATGSICIALRSKSGFLRGVRGKPSIERTSEQLRELLEKLGMEHSSEKVVSTLDVRPILEGGSKGEMLLEFLLKDEIRDLKPQPYDAVLEYVRQSNDSGYLQQIDEFIWIPNPQSLRSASVS
jgi:SAM-dependent methyltransferase